jgi:hypothetical protein
VRDSGAGEALDERKFGSATVLVRNERKFGGKEPERAMWNDGAGAADGAEREEIWQPSAASGGISLPGTQPAARPGKSLLGEKGVELTQRGGGDGISWDRRRPTARLLLLGSVSVVLGQTRFPFGQTRFGS